MYTDVPVLPSTIWCVSHMFYVIYCMKSQGYAMKKFNFQTREIVNVPVMTPDGVQAFVGAVCMLEK